MLLSARTEHPSTDIIRLVCEASSRPASAITWDAVMSGISREPLENGTDESYSIGSSVDLEAVPPVSSSYLEYDPDEVDFSNPDCFIDNGFEVMRVRTFAEASSASTPTSNSEFIEFKVFSCR